MAGSGEGDTLVSEAPVTVAVPVPVPAPGSKKRSSAKPKSKGEPSKKRARAAAATTTTTTAASTKKASKKNDAAAMDAPLPDSGDDTGSDAEKPGSNGGVVRRPRRRPAPPPPTSVVPASPRRLPPPPPVPAYAAVLDILNSPHGQLNDEVFDTFVPLILAQCSDDVAGTRRELEARRDMLVFTPLRLQAVLSDYYHRRLTNSDTVFTKLGTTREAVAAASLLVAIVHGPMTEEHATSLRLYGQARGDSASASAADGDDDDALPSSASNFHWSVVVYSRKLNMAYHYDSNHPMNRDRCIEVLGVLQKSGVLPPDASDVATPAFFPTQKKYWECGYYVLTALIIMADNSSPEPLTESDIAVYHHFFSTIHHAKGCLIKDRLRAMLVYSLV
jgi:hypothetical protein